MNQTPSWMFNQSGVIPYRYCQGELELMLITSRRRKRWVIPKGIIEGPLTPRESAAQEAWEEAGITGQVSQSAINSYRYNKWGGTCQVKVFLLQVETVLDNWPERWRDRQWLSVKEAASRVDEEELKQIILAVPELLKKQGSKGNL